uniref:DUF4283 domain-containing protein n=1 Tax=Tanacetum cinerariifolium TaxID=118510 RepID=A0A6L2NT49_TANCI|nr:hypothetical protein [Tanacetum cinerariifolium]
MLLTHRASTSANLEPMISPAFVESKYEVLESLLKEQWKQIRNEDLHTELEYFSEEYDEEREMESRLLRVRETTLVLRTRSLRARRQRERVVEFEHIPNRDGSRVKWNSEGERPSKHRVDDNMSQGMNLPPLLAAHLGRSENGQPRQSSLTSAYEAKFGLKNLMKNEDGVLLFKFASKDGLDIVLERGPWIIRNTPLILNRWTPNVSLKRDEVTKVPVWIKLHNVPVVAYSVDGLSLIATQVGKPIMLDAFKSSMCEDSWDRINFERAFMEINADYVLKHEVSMGIPLEDGSGYTKEVIKVEYEWKPPHCTDCKLFRHISDKFSKRMTLDTPFSMRNKTVREPVIASIVSKNSDGFTEVKWKKNKGKKADLQTSSRHIDGIRLNKPKPNFYWPKKGTNMRGADVETTTQVGTNDINKVKGSSTSNSFDALNNMDIEAESGVSSTRGIQEEELKEEPKTSQWNEDLVLDDEVNEFVFPEGDKFRDKFDIRLKAADGVVVVVRGVAAAVARGEVAARDIVNRVDRATRETFWVRRKKPAGKVFWRRPEAAAVVAGRRWAAAGGERVKC